MILLKRETHMINKLIMVLITITVAIKLMFTHLTHRPLGDLNEILDVSNLVIDGWGISWEIALRWMLLDLYWW